MADYNKKRKLIILTGPTAVGKSALSIELAKRIDGEIVSADSMQVGYRFRQDQGSGYVRHSPSFDQYSYALGRVSCCPL